jgi:hypothetical protein
MYASDFDASITFSCEDLKKIIMRTYVETFRVEEMKNGHSCKSVSKEGYDITHTKEMMDGRLFLHCGTDDKDYEYYQINRCPFCGYKAKQQITTKV